jgi:hypothetical protein
MSSHHDSRVTRLGEFSPVRRLFILGIFLKITKVAHIFGLPFLTVKEMCWAMFWAIFSQTHMLTLILTLGALTEVRLACNLAPRGEI